MQQNQLYCLFNPAILLSCPNLAPGVISCNPYTLFNIWHTNCVCVCVWCISVYLFTLRDLSQRHAALWLTSLWQNSSDVCDFDTDSVFYYLMMNSNPLQTNVRKFCTCGCRCYPCLGRAEKCRKLSGTPWKALWRFMKNSAKSHLVVKNDHCSFSHHQSARVFFSAVKS